VLGVPDPRDIERLARGVTVDGRPTAPADVRLIPGGSSSGSNRKDRGEHATLLIAVREGRNRQVRNMCEAVGHPVTHLRRIAIGPITDSRLKPGQWRDLTAAEVRKLQAAADHAALPVPSRDKGQKAEAKKLPR
jgi:pseudouridine synthase